MLAVAYAFLSALMIGHAATQNIDLDLAFPAPKPTVPQDDDAAVLINTAMLLAQAHGIGNATGSFDNPAVVPPGYIKAFNGLGSATNA
jgi:hypothetical protein